MKRLLVSLASLALCVLLSEGALSLFLGKTWRGLLAPRGFLDALDEVRVQSDEERFRAAARTPGPYRRTEDPLVGYALKADTVVLYDAGERDLELATDELGLRRRPGPAPGSDAFRIVILGDSVAFGHGLADEEVLAVQLERVLREARPSSAREITCRTVAIPSWNYRNALRFLLDHLDRFDPDLVLYMPVENDLDDSYGANEAGQRCESEDPGVPHPLLHFRPEWGFLKFATNERRAAGLEVDEERCGPQVLCAGLSESSRWRRADLVRLLLHVEERLARRGARLALVPHEETDHQRLLRAELAAAGHELPVIPLLEAMRREDTLGWDPHPSAATTRSFALWIAQSLQELGWLPDGGLERPLPALDPGQAGRRARVPGADEARAWKREYQTAVEADLERVISADTLQGMLQVYGGLNLDATLAAQFAAVLPRGRVLRVVLGPVEDRPDLYPLEVSVHVDERRIGSVRVTGAGPSEGVFPLSEAESAAAFEVRLEPHDWAVVTRRGKSWVAAARLVEIASLAE